MPKLSISLLGTPVITLDDQPLDAKTYKATALLAFLALSGQSHTRLELATLLWTEYEKEKALAALRTTLWKLRQTQLDQWLRIQRSSISLEQDEDLELDVTQFQRLISESETHGHPIKKTCAACLPPLVAAVDLYRGDFMKGFSLRDAGEFDSWQSMNTEVYRQAYRQCLEKLVQGHRALGEIKQAIQYARIWAAHDRYNEDTHRQLMNLYLSIGQRANALTQYRELSKLLRRDNLEPQPETSQLYYQILDQKTNRTLRFQKFNRPILLAMDIDNELVLWTNNREQAIRTMNRYQGILRECANQHGGQVIRQTGATFIASFDRGYPAHCALRIHQRVSQIRRSPDERLKIRLALFSTDHHDHLSNDSHLDFKLVQSLLNASWGGQVLLTTRVINAIELPQNSQVVDLGIHWLKDMHEPIRIYQLDHPDLPLGTFPPLQSLPSFRHNLPDYPTAFIDREKEQADLAQILANKKCRLLTILGPGGVGKTRLALQVAANQAQNFIDGIYFIPVVVPKTPDLIPSVIAETFKLHFFEKKAPSELIDDYLREKNTLLIFDNFEHLVEGSLFLSQLLANAPSIKIIVTSRERLNLRDECVYEIQGMNFPPPGVTSNATDYGAVQLFIHNARRMLADFAPNPQELEAINRICYLVDGIPLAIELATAWVRTLPCQEIASEIENNMDFLSSKMRDIPARHRSLRAVFEHSWSLLSEEGRRTLRRLAIFRGGFTADAALQISKASPLILASFVDQSLLRQLPEGRYEMIEVLRHFALLKLEENQEDYCSTRNLHCDYYSNLLAQKFDELIGPQQNQAINEIRAEIENIRSAWACGVNNDNWSAIEKALFGLMAYKEVLGHNREELEMLKTALDKLQTSSFKGKEKLKANLQNRAGWMAFCLGDHISGMRGLQTALEAFNSLDLPLEAATTLYMMSKGNARLDHSQLAIEQVEKCLHVFRDEQYANQKKVKSLLANALAVYGLVLLKTNQVNKAKSVLHESLQINQKLGTRFGSISVLDALSRAQIAEGDLNGAQTSRLHALALAKEIGNKHTIAGLLNNISHNYITFGEYEKAFRYQEDSIKLSREIGHRWLTAIGLNNLAFLNIEWKHDYQTGNRHYRESLEIYEGINDLRGMVFTMYDLGMSAYKETNFELSYSLFMQALEQAVPHNSPEITLYILSGIAIVLAKNGQPETAYQICHLLLSHPEANNLTRKNATKTKEELEDILTFNNMQMSAESGKDADLDQILNKLLG